MWKPLIANRLYVHDCFPRVEAYKMFHLQSVIVLFDKPNMFLYERSPYQWWEGRESDVKKRLNSTLVEEACKWGAVVVGNFSYMSMSPS